jgi:hypothetical protein
MAFAIADAGASGLGEHLIADLQMIRRHVRQRRLRDLENRECPGWQGRDDDGGAQSARTAPAHPPRQW